MRVLAVDLGGSHAACALVEDNTILFRETLCFANSEKLVPVLPSVEDALRRLMSQSSYPIAGIAFGFCGLVDSRRNFVASTNGKYIDAPDLDLAAWAEQKLGLRLRLENDARLALRGECYAGAAQGETNVVMFTLGTGIGGVVMIEGRPLRGKHGQAGALGGHVPVRLNGRACTCGAIGCAESEASGWALPIVSKEWPDFATSMLASVPLNFENLFSCAAQGDLVAQQVREHCLQVWAMTAVSAIHSFDPEVLLYGGGVMKSADVILPYIEDYVHRHAWTAWGKVQVRAAQLGNDAALLGAIPLLNEELENVR